MALSLIERPITFLCQDTALDISITGQDAKPNTKIPAKYPAYKKFRLQLLLTNQENAKTEVKESTSKKPIDTGDTAYRDERL